MNYIEKIEKYIEKEKDTLEMLEIKMINQVMNILENARVNHNRIFICGNGGSGVTAIHFECDFNKGISYNQKIKYDVECLNNNMAMLTAIANDLKYEDVFVIPLQNKLNEGDIVIGISGSGNSENVVLALEYAHLKGAITVGLVGYDGGRVKDIVDYCIHVNINDIQIVEDIHLMINHMMMQILSE